MQKVIFNFLSVLLLLAGSGNAQTGVKIRGWVTAEADHSPVAAAFIQVQQTGSGAMSDENGYFRIENLHPGTYDLLVSCLGFETQQIQSVRVYSDTPAEINIRLITEPLSGETIFVAASDSGLTGGFEGQKMVITGKALERYRNLGLEKLLQQVPGIQLESAAGGSGARIRIHGSKSSQVLVLLDGQRISNPQSGEVDLDLIPLDQVEKIEIIPQGNTARYGGNAFAGVLHFFSREVNEHEHITVGGGYGSFESATGKFSAALRFGVFSILSGYQQNWARRDFEYQYNQKTFTRENAWQRDRQLFLKTAYRTGRFPGHLLFQSKTGNRGLPSSNYNEQLHYGADMSENFTTIQWQQKLLWTDNFYSDMNSGYQALDQTFNNESQPSPYLRYKTRSRSETFEIRQQNYIEPIDEVELIAGFQYLNEKLNQTDLLFQTAGFGKKSRESNAAFAGVDARLPLLKNILKSWNFRGILRYENAFDKSWNWFPSAGMSFQPAFYSKLFFDLSWSESVRYPDFNSLFWKGDTRASGNPDLQPEKNRSWMGQIHMQRHSKYLPELQLRLFHESIDDLIFWHRGVNGTWQPRNLYRAVKKGMDLHAEQNLIADYLQIQIGYNYLDAINLSGEPTTDGKTIIFTPRQTFNSQLLLQFEPFSCLVIFRAVGERETVEYNTSGTQLSAYRLWDASLIYSKKFSPIEMTTEFTIKNITDQSYELIYGYPMPGREINLSINLKWSVNK